MSSCLMRVGVISLIGTAATLCSPPLPAYKQSGPGHYRAAGSSPVAGSCQMSVQQRAGESEPGT